jgi:protein phosphatase
LSIDHNLVSELVKNGEISADEAKSHPQRNVLTRAVGIGAKVEIDLITQSLLPGDVVLLASDGLFTLLDNQAIARHLTTEQDLQKVAENLVAAANELGGHDNISVVLAKWGWDG